MRTIELSAQDFIREDGCGRQHRVLLKKALIARDAMQSFDDVLRGCGFDGDFAVIYDENSYEALRGRRPKAKQEIILPPERLHADERGVALAEERLGDAKLLIAAGAGTVHDITRYLCAGRGLPFGSVGIPAACFFCRLLYLLTQPFIWAFVKPSIFAISCRLFPSSRSWMIICSLSFIFCFDIASPPM